MRCKKDHAKWILHLEQSEKKYLLCFIWCPIHFSFVWCVYLLTYFNSNWCKENAHKFRPTIKIQFECEISVRYFGLFRQMAQHTVQWSMNIQLIFFYLSGISVYSSPSSLLPSLVLNTWIKKLHGWMDGWMNECR